MKDKYSKVLVAITNDKYEYIVGLWENTLQCAKELGKTRNDICSAICRKVVVRKINAKLEWLVVEND